MDRTEKVLGNKEANKPETVVSERRDQNSSRFIEKLVEG